MRTFNVLLEIEAAIGLEAEEGPDDGRGGDLVDQAAEDLMGPRHEELAELDSLHQVILVSLRSHADQVHQGAVGGGVAHFVFLTHGLQSPAQHEQD